MKPWTLSTVAAAIVLFVLLMVLIIETGLAAVIFKGDPRTAPSAPNGLEYYHDPIHGVSCWSVLYGISCLRDTPTP